MEENHLAKKIAVATIFMIIHLEMRLKVMADWADRTHSLMVRLNVQYRGHVPSWMRN